MNVATQRSGTDLASPTKRLFRIHGASDVIAATQRTQSERILQWQQIHRHTVTAWTTETELLSSHSNAIRQPTLRRRQREPLDKVFSHQSG
jgi:hypothetical protein